MASSAKDPGFEKTISRLEEIVEKLEGDELGLEESLKLFEEGVKLAALCGKRLDEAEKKISLLVKDRQGKLKETAFEETPED